MLNSGNKPAACHVEPEVNSLRSIRQDVAPPLFHKMIKGSDTDYTAAYDNYPCV